MKLKQTHENTLVSKHNSQISDVKESEKLLGTFTKTCKNQMNDPLRLNAKISASDYSSYRCLSTLQDDVYHFCIGLQTLVSDVITGIEREHPAINDAADCNNCKKCFKNNKYIDEELSTHPFPWTRY
jgi:hypothetical protein